jgi:RND superfamily putative drug exporter
LRNPFEFIADINQSYKKIIVPFVLILTIAFVPFALRTFTATNADFGGFLPKNLESGRVDRILEQEFPGRSDSSVVILLQSKNTSLDVFNEQVVTLIQELNTELQAEEEIPELNLTSWVSLEEDIQGIFQETMLDLQSTLAASLVPILNDYQGNITLMKELLSEYTTLAKSIELFAQILDFYLLTYYDFARSIYYLSNLTTAYSSYFYPSDYDALYPLWDNTTGDLNQIMVLQAYFATFGVIDPLSTPHAAMDGILNDLVLGFFNQSMGSTIPVEYLPAVNQLLLLLESTWGTNFANETTFTSMYGSLELTPQPSLNQRYLLARLVNVSVLTLSDLFTTVMADSQLQAGLESLQGVLDLSGDLIPTVNSSLIAKLHDAPLQFMGLWFDLSRAVFYLSNATAAYQDGLNITHLNTINTTWVGALFGLPNQNYLLSNQSYLSTSMIIPPTGLPLGTLMYLNATLGDTTLNDLAFNFANGSAFQQWIVTTGGTQGYLQSPEYQYLLLLRDTWSLSWNTSYEIGGPLFGDFRGPPDNSTTISISQLGVFGRLIGIASSTFQAYASKIFSTMNFTDSGAPLSYKITSTSSSEGIAEVIGLTIKNETELQDFVAKLSAGILTQYAADIPINISILTTALTSQIIPLAVFYRDTGFPPQVLQDIIVNLFVALLEGTDITSFLDPSLFGGMDLGSLEINTTQLLAAINFTELVTSLYLTTVPASNMTTLLVAGGISQTLTSQIALIVPEPTIHSLPQPVTKSLISTDNLTTLLVISFPEAEGDESFSDSVKPIRALLKELVIANNLDNDLDYWVTGGLAQLYDSSHSMNEDLETVDIVAVVLVIVLLSLVFLSFIAPIIPLLAIGIAIVEAIGFVFIVVTLAGQEIPTLMLALLSVTMLGAGVDYCLFILWRYKEERQFGRNKYLAIRAATVHAGESVVSSGSTVMIGFGSLLLSTFPLLNQMGLGPMVGIGFSLLAALTIIPLILHFLGDKAFFPRNFQKDYDKNRSQIQADIKAERDGAKKTDKPRRFSIKAMSHWTVKHPWPVILAFLAVTAFFTVKTMDIRVSYDTADLLPLNVESMDGFQAMEGIFPKGQLYPIKVVLQFTDPISQPNDPMYDLVKLQQIEAYAAEIDQDFSLTSDGEVLVSQINTVTRPNGVPINFSEILDPLTLGVMTQFVGPVSNTTVVLDIIMDVDPIGGESLAFVGNLRSWTEEYQSAHVAEGFGVQTVDIIIGGTTASFKDMSDIIERETPLIVAFVLIGIFIVLYLITGSIFTPIRLELTILMTVIITLGASQLFFVEFLGYGISWIMPIMLFVLIFGLGMDYDIFIITRMREEVALRGLSDEDAILEALDKSSTIITAAGLIMASSLGSLFVADSAILKLFGFAFFIGILLDATLVRQLLVPAIMVVAKRANWWNPIKRLQRVPSEEKREWIREAQLEKLSQDHKQKDLTDSQLAEFSEKMKHYSKDLKKLEKMRKKVSHDEFLNNLDRIEKSIRNLPRNVRETFILDVRRLIKRIEVLRHHRTDEIFDAIAVDNLKFKLEK